MEEGEGEEEEEGEEGVADNRGKEMTLDRQPDEQPPPAHTGERGRGLGTISRAAEARGSAQHLA